MEKRKKPTDVPSEKAEQYGWLEIIKILHEYLPEDFPEIKAEGEDHRVMSELEHVIYTKKDGALAIAPTHLAYEKISIQYRLLSIFLEEFKGNPKKPFYFANLPFIFVAKAFVERYAEKVTKQQMKIILRALRLNEETIKDYLKIFNPSFRKNDVDQFIDDFLGYVSKGQNVERYLFPFREIMENLKISEDQLIDFEGEVKIEVSEIYITVRKKHIIYEPHLPSD